MRSAYKNIFARFSASQALQDWLILHVLKWKQVTKKIIKSIYSKQTRLTRDTLKHAPHKLLTKKKFQNTLTLKLHSMVDENAFSLLTEIAKLLISFTNTDN